MLTKKQSTAETGIPMAGATIPTTLVIKKRKVFKGSELITGHKRVASAVALTDCKLHTMDKETFELSILNDKMFMRKILKTLAIRLEETDITLKQHLKILISRFARVY